MYFNTRTQSFDDIRNLQKLNPEYYTGYRLVKERSSKTDLVNRLCALLSKEMRENSLKNKQKLAYA